VGAGLRSHGMLRRNSRCEHFQFLHQPVRAVRVERSPVGRGGPNSDNQDALFIRDQKAVGVSTPEALKVLDIDPAVSGERGCGLKDRRRTELAA
jgi:hypothetical protein